MTVVILLKAQTEILTATVQLSRELPMEIRLLLLPAAILTPEEIPVAALIQAAIPAEVPQSLLTAAVRRLRHSHQAAEVQAAAQVEAQDL